MIPMTYTEKMCTTVANQLADYPFVFLGLAHVTSTGGLLLNFQPLDSSPDPCILPGIQELTNNGQIVMLTIGGQDSGLAGGDYANMQANYATFWSNLQGVLSAYGFAGVDLDLEAEYSPYLDTLVQLVNDLSAAQYIVTAPPYEEPQFWTQLATQSAWPDGFPKIFAYNIQLYGSGMTYDQWVAAFQNVVPDPQVFLGSGYLSGQNTPAQITSSLNSLLANNPYSTLAYIWRFPTYESGFTAANYAQAISAAAPPSPSSAPDIKARVRAHRERLAKEAKRKK